MTILQIALSTLVGIDIFVTIYAQVKKLDVDDEYFIFQKSFNIYTSTIAKIIIGIFLVYYLNVPTLLYGPVISVPAYGFFVLLMSYKIWRATRSGKRHLKKS